MMISKGNYLSEILLDLQLIIFFPSLLLKYDPNIFCMLISKLKNKWHFILMKTIRSPSL